MDADGNIKIKTKDGVTNITMVTIVKHGSDCWKSIKKAEEKV